MGRPLAAGLAVLAVWILLAGGWEVGVEAMVADEMATVQVAVNGWLSVASGFFGLLLFASCGAWFVGRWRAARLDDLVREATTWMVMGRIGPGEVDRLRAIVAEVRRGPRVATLPMALVLLAFALAAAAAITFNVATEPQVLWMVSGWVALVAAVACLAVAGRLWPHDPPSGGVPRSHAVDQWHALARVAHGSNAPRAPSMERRGER